jgi:hypothetical protein
MRCYDVRMADNEKREVVVARIKPSLVAKLRWLADHERRSLSAMIEIAVEELLTRKMTVRKAKR